jgi:hypothetical protein
MEALLGTNVIIRLFCDYQIAIVRFTKAPVLA